MELFGKTAALCIVCAVLALLIRKKKPEFAFCAVTACCAVCLLAAAELIAPVLSFLGTLQKLAGLDDAVMAPLLKTVGIGLLTQAACAFCQDAGQSSLAKKQWSFAGRFWPSMCRCRWRKRCWSCCGS